jgi:hypothetical protein
VIFLFGERVKRASVALGDQDCPICQRAKPFSHIQETNYFCLFGIRVLPLEKNADYYSCDYCENAFQALNAEGKLVPSQLHSVQRVLAYLLVGYSLQDQGELACDIFKKVTGFELRASDLREDVKSIALGHTDLFSELKQQNRYLNQRGKQQIIEAAFLVTHSFCEIQYEDRLRINLIASSIGLSIAFVSATIDQVRQQGCYGVRRVLATQTQA